MQTIAEQIEDLKKQMAELEELVELQAKVDRLKSRLIGEPVRQAIPPIWIQPMPQTVPFTPHWEPYQITCGDTSSTLPNAKVIQTYGIL